MLDNTSITVALTILVSLTAIQFMISKGIKIHQSKLLNLLGSIQFAMGLLLILVLVLIASSITEAQMGRQYVDSYFYNAKWFELFLSAIFINIFASTVVKMSKSLKDRFGFVSTHAGILILIVGAIISKYYGIEGTIRLNEGGNTNLLSMDHTTLKINDFNFDMSKPGFNFNQPIKHSIDNDTDILINSYEPYGNIHLVHSRANAPFDQSLPAVKIKIKTQLNLNTKWLTLNDESLEHFKAYDFPIAKQSIHFELIKIKPVNLLQFLQSTSTLSYIGRSFENAILVASCSNGKFYFSSNILGVHKSGLLKENKLASLGVKGLTFHVQYAYHHAVLKQDIITKKWLDDSSYNHPIVSVQLLQKSNKKSSIIHADLGTSKQIHFNDKVYDLALLPRKIELPFQISLLDFRTEYHTNSEMIKSFQSDIQLKNIRSGVQNSKTILKNHVLDHEGWRIFQANYSKDHGIEGAVFQLVYDPGVQTIYLGCFILLLGMASVFALNYKNEGAM